MKKLLITLFFGVILLNSSAQAQSFLKVNLDCVGCDYNYIRQELSYISFVRDLALADVQVFIRRLGNSSGGQTFTIKIINMNDEMQSAHTLTYQTMPQMTGDEVREGMLKYIQVGLAPYLMNTSLADSVYHRVNYTPSDSMITAMEKDPWKYWVFRLNVEGDLEQQSTQGASEFEYGFEANQITEEMKVRTRGELNFEKNTFEQEDTTDIVRLQRRHFFYYNVIKSMGPHWSSGVFGGFNHNTFDNLFFQYDLGPALEYSIFPYDEAIRRELIIAYRLIFQQRDYIETTIFGKQRETLLSNNLVLMAQYRQPWGYVFGMIQGSAFLHDLSRNRLTFDTWIDIRLLQGLNLRISGNYERVRDQLGLPGGDISLEDRLLAQRQIATDYFLRFGVGLSFTFGSAFEGIVNTRL